MTTTAAKLFMPVEHRLTLDLPPIPAPARSLRVCLVKNYNRSYVFQPAFGLGYLASVLREDGHEVAILDGLKNRMSLAEFEGHLRRYEYDVIGFQIYSYDVHLVIPYLEAARRLQSRAVLILGGAHPSGDPEGTLMTLPLADFAMKAEGEIGVRQFASLVSELKFDQLGEASRGAMDPRSLVDVSGLIWRNGDGVKVNRTSFVPDLDEVPFPAWDLMDPREYPEAPHGAFARGFPSAPIIFNRGCPYKCTFCAAHTLSPRKQRRRSTANVLAEMAHLQSKYGVKEFHFEDDCFNCDREAVIDFCTTVLKESRQLSWGCPSGVRLDRLDPDILGLMERAGCYSFGLGIEVGSERMMKMVKKGETAATVAAKVRMVGKTKIKTTGFFILGYPDETQEDIEATIKLALALPIGRAQFNNFMPLPGTESMERMRAEGEVGPIDWSAVFVHDASFPPKGMTSEELKSLQRKAYLRFYLRPHIIWGLLKEVRSWRHLKRLIDRFLDAVWTPTHISKTGRHLPGS